MRKLITKLLEPKDNAPEAAFLLTKLLSGKISRSSLEKDIKRHPNYPTFLSISDVLNNYGVETITARFDKDKLLDLPTPFITQVWGKRKTIQFTVVKEVSKGEVTFYDPEEQSWEKTRINDFLENTNMLILLAEIDEPVKEKDYEIKVREEQRLKLSQNIVVGAIPLLVLIEILFSLTGNNSGVIWSTLYTVLALIGTLITTLLLWYEVDQTNSALNDICTIGKKVNCSAILQSKDAKIFGISWSSIGFVYFSGSLTMLLFSGIDNATSLFILSYITLAASPYVIYSVYYQWKLVKQWCILCLCVQAVLLSQLVVTFIGDWHHLEIFWDLKIVIPLITSYAIPFIVIRILIPALQKAKEGDYSALELQRLKHSPEIFQAVLEKQKVITHSTQGLGITIGNPNGSIKLIKVCNPYCGPCARAHNPIEDLLNNNPDLQVQVIFNAHNDDKDIKSYPVRHLLAIDQKNDKKLTEQALGNWYLAEDKNYTDFAKKYPMNGELNLQGDKIEAMMDWCTKTDILFTPTFFLNGYQLPSNYTVNDLKYFLSI